ncbi:hypothetical protein BOX15_Mlig021485g1 [Macrostomum lignano]|uniref:C2H2-type domain-containing protein n=1 Tax=Macrostomum lignano TaxID=282301 RepID=A0A267G1W4_9PLAT|nr:hypothetical protein BOX15_Mlig021485g1 [Macrostomum lignano]
MSSVEQLTTIDRAIVEPNPSGTTASDSFSNWDLLGDLMIDLGGGNTGPADQGPLKMQNSSASENLAPATKPDSDKGLVLKMKIKRKSKNEEKHEIVTPDMEKYRLLSAPSVKLEEADSSATHAPAAKKSRPDKSSGRHASASSSTGHSGSGSSGKRDAWANTATVGTGIEPDCLGPCDSGTSVSLDGLVWLETDTGVLVVNVTWRGRTYVGTLLDSSRHDFAPPCSAPGASTSAAGANNCSSSNPEDPESSNSNGAGSRWCQQQLNGQHQHHHHHHSLAYQHAQHHGGRGRGNRRRGGRPLARQLPLANGSSAGSNGGGGPELPHIRCPEPGCDKRFAQLQALKWHSINQHSQQRQQQQPQDSPSGSLREEKSLDGSSVFKVPQQQAVSKPQSAAGVVTVSRTCPVPYGPPPQAGSAGFKAIQTKPGKAGRRSADPVSPAYSDISDEGGAPVLEREDEQQQQHKDQQQQQQQPLARSLSANEAIRAKSLPPTQHQARPPSASAASAAVAATSAVATQPPRTPSTSSTTSSGHGAPPKPSLGHSPSDGADARPKATAPPQQPPPPSQAPSSAPAVAPSAVSAAGRPPSMFQPSPQRRPSQPSPSASSPRFGQQHQQHPGAAAAAAAAMAAGFDPYRMSSYQHLPGLEALSQYAAAAAAMSSGRQQQQQQQQQPQHPQLHHQQQHKIHELGRKAASPKASPPTPNGRFPASNGASSSHHQQLHQQHLQHHLANLHQQHQRSQPPPHHHLMEQFSLPFTLTSQMMQSAQAPHYLHPK